MPSYNDSIQTMRRCTARLHAPTAITDGLGGMGINADKLLFTLYQYG